MGNQGRFVCGWADTRVSGQGVTRLWNAHLSVAGPPVVLYLDALVVCFASMICLRLDAASLPNAKQELRAHPHISQTRAHLLCRINRHGMGQHPMVSLR